MFSTDPNQIRGMSLPHKTLCFTFDDGPAPRTIDLARYLNEQNISATFFAYGRHIIEFPYVLPEVFRLGHTVGNHTLNHFDMASLHANRGWVEPEVQITDSLISNCISDNTVFFRAPYGSWNPTLSAQLNENLVDSEFLHIGPINWDIERQDYRYWAGAIEGEICARTYIEEINRVGRGIVLIHDSSADNPVARQNNKSLEMVRALIPELKSQGYSFVSLRQIPDIMAILSSRKG